MGRDALDLDAQGKPVQELGPQLALFRVHGADQDKARRVAEGDALSLHDVAPHGRRVQQQVDYVVVQQVHLVNVEQAPVGRSQHARLELFPAGLDRHLDIQRADHPVLGGADRQIHEARGPVVARKALPPGHPLAAIVAKPLGAGRIAAKGAIGYYVDLGQQCRQRSGRSRLGGAALSTDQNSAYVGADGVEDQRRFHRILADYGGEGKDNLHGLLSCSDGE